MPQITPGPTFSPARMVVAATVPLTIYLAIGTGRDARDHSYSEGTGGSINQYNWRSDFPFAGAKTSSVENADIQSASTADDIDFIKDSLKISSTALARYLGVSRQALYDWRAGGHIKAHNISKLENLRAAAEVIASSNASLPELQLTRKLPGGGTLLDSIASGADGRSAAKSLVTMLRREAVQRESLRARFAGRRPASESLIGDGMTALREPG